MFFAYSESKLTSHFVVVVVVVVLVLVLVLGENFVNFIVFHHTFYNF